MTQREITIIDLTQKGYSDSYIAKLFNVTGSAIAQQRRKLGIIKSLEDQVNSQTKNFEYFNIFESDILPYLVGTLLGDGWLTKSSDNSYRGGIGHSEKQLCYLEYKRELLKPIVTNIGIYSKKTKKQILNGKIIKESEIFLLRFKSSSYLKQLYNILYYEGKKILTKEYLQFFNEASLALFYFDDGYKISYNKSSAYKIVNYDLNIESRLLFKEFLFEKFGLTCSIQSNAFLFSKENAIKFKSIVEKYSVECVKYKL